MAGTGRMSPKEFAARLEVLCSDAQGEVREACRRVVRSVRKDEPPAGSDLAVVLVHVVGLGEALQWLVRGPEVPRPERPADVPPPEASSVRKDPLGRPSRSPFADRIREQEGRSEVETPEDLDVRRRFGVSSDEQGRRRRQEDR